MTKFLECKRKKVMSRTLIGPRIAVYPGSFNPFHMGHFDVLEQALKVFDEVYVAIGINRQKSIQKDSIARWNRVMSQLGNFENSVSVEVYNTLLTNYIQDILNKRKRQIKKVHVIRGLRSGHDLDYEINFRKTISDLNSKIEFVYFLPSNPSLYHISSSMIRELATYDLESAKKYIYNAKRLGDEIFIP